VKSNQQALPYSIPSAHCAQALAQSHSLPGCHWMACRQSCALQYSVAWQTSNTSQQSRATNGCVGLGASRARGLLRTTAIPSTNFAPTALCLRGHPGKPTLATGQQQQMPEPAMKGIPSNACRSKTPAGSGSGAAVLVLRTPRTCWW
jgi:hypothetical protein